MASFRKKERKNQAKESNRCTPRNERYGTELSTINGRMLYVPERCAHGYQTLEESTEMYYMTSAFYTQSAARGVRFDDLAFGIQRHWALQRSPSGFLAGRSSGGRGRP